MQAQQVLETCLYVDDLTAAEEFYRRVLGLEFVDRQPGRHVFFRCGNSMLLLFDPTSSEDEQSTWPPHGAHGPGHVAFAAQAADLDRWRQHLQHEAVEIERVIDWPSGGRSLYFRDPAGNSLEVATPAIWGL